MVKKNSRRRNPRTKQRYQTLTEIFRFDVQAGADLPITPSKLSLAANRCWRPVTLKVEAIGGYVQTPDNALDVPGGVVPVAIQLDFCDPSTHYVATSGVKVIGANPRTVTIRYPRSGDWFEPDVAVNQKIAVISGICLGAVNNAGSQTARVRGVAHVTVHYGNEASPNSCPAPTLYVGDDPSSSFVRV